MPESIFTIIILVILALIFDFINGFHDTANAVATAIATEALKPKQAIVLAAVLNLIGALVFTGVAHTIGEGIADPARLADGSLVIFTALLSGITWNLITWFFGIPSSSSHALIGSLAGAAAGAAGLSAVNFKGLISIIKSLFISPVLAIVLGFIIMSVIKFIVPTINSSKAQATFRKLQIFTACFQAFSHGSNDAQKTMGVITFALVAEGILQEMTVPLWVKLSAALAMALGTSVGGWRIIRTVSRRITNLQPANGFAADISSAGIIICATLLKLPVSTTHIISSSIVGVGINKGVLAVNWYTVRSLFYAWLITLPASFIMGIVLFNIIIAINPF